MAKTPAATNPSLPGMGKKDATAPVIQASPQPTPPGNVRVGATAGQLASVHGSPAPNGKPRKDGLVPGSKEAIEADREKARLAKADQRARKKSAALPPALPNAIPGIPLAIPVRVNPPGPQVETGAAPAQLEDVEMVPWIGADIEPAVLDTIALLELAEGASIEGKLQKANLDQKSIKAVMEEVPWPERSKKALTRYGGSTLAKALNAVGISAKQKDIVLLAPSLAYLIYDRVKLHNRLDALIKAANAAKTPEPGKTP